MACVLTRWPGAPFGASPDAGMKLSLHRLAIQAQGYYSDVEIEDNPATALLETLR